MIEYGGLDVDQSFALLRKYSRDRSLRLTDVALQLLDRQLPADVVLARVPEKALDVAPPELSSRVGRVQRATARQSPSRISPSGMQDNGTDRSTPRIGPTRA
jgi:hypothetical protein